VLVSAIEKDEFIDLTTELAVHLSLQKL